MNRQSILRKLFPIALSIAWGLMLNSVLLGGFSKVMAYDYPPGQTPCVSKQVGPNCWCYSWQCYKCYTCSTGRCKQYASPSGCSSCSEYDCTS